MHIKKEKTTLKKQSDLVSPEAKVKVNTKVEAAVAESQTK
jgi:hypothetical protein